MPLRVIAASTALIAAASLVTTTQFLHMPLVLVTKAAVFAGKFGTAHEAAPAIDAVAPYIVYKASADPCRPNANGVSLAATGTS